jgi:K+-transporting ATPase ATPase A chain
MEFREWLQLALFLSIILGLAKPLGSHFVKVLDPGERPFLHSIFGPIERFIYRASGIDPLAEQDWKNYLACILGFSLISFIFTAALLSAQYYLPLNPQKFVSMAWHLNINTAMSFLTNTNWQNYSGESALSYFSQMTALTVQNFVSAAVGICAGAALVRGLSRKEKNTIGNFWADLTRITLYVLLPISIVAASLFISEGVPQNLNAYTKAITLEGASQTILQGPIASQEAIKLLGTNGGGFTNVNSAHPYENPTPLSNFLQLVLIFLISTSLIYYFGVSVKNTKHAGYILAALSLVFVAGFMICYFQEIENNPEWANLGLFGGNWEGKEQRFGIFNSTLFACVTTVTSCGAVNCMHDSFTPLAGFIPMLNIQLSETIIGGVGAGLYSVLSFVFLAIFIAGLIVGRTPEYLGKKIEAYEIKMSMLANLAYVFIVLAFTAWAAVSAWGLAGLGNTGPHGFSEILYAFSSCAANNGSAFAGLTGSTLPYDLTLTFAMFSGRFTFMAPMIALAGSLALKKIHPTTAASFPVTSVIFISLLIGVILLLGALNFLPALTMGPIIEHFSMLKGALFP